MSGRADWLVGRAGLVLRVWTFVAIWATWVGKGMKDERLV